MSARPVLTRKPGTCPFDNQECIRTRSCGFNTQSEACVNYDLKKRDGSYSEACHNCAKHAHGCRFECIRRDFLKRIRNEGKP